MPQIVETKARQVCGLTGQPQTFTKCLGRRIGFKAARRGEQPLRARQAAGLHVTQMCFQFVVKIHGAGLAVLGQAVGTDRQLAFGPVDIVPAEPQGFGHPGTGKAHQPDIIHKLLGVEQRVAFFAGPGQPTVVKPRFKGNGAKLFNSFDRLQLAVHLG